MQRDLKLERYYYIIVSLIIPTTLETPCNESVNVNKTKGVIKTHLF